MKIHIIANEIETNPTHVISRIFLDLAKNAKYTISEQPDDFADINYFSLYLLYPKENYVRTPTAALFSHKEENSKAKIQEWERVAQSVDIRLCWAEKYEKELKKYGATFIVTPYLDRIKFNFDRG